ncbi:Pentatricopeptide repeat-containing protein, partial [Thalictrum thalictroides]
SERSKVVVGVEGEGSAAAKPRQRGIITKEELDKMKFKACAICGVADDHAMSLGPWYQGCPSTNVVGPKAEIVCWCCEEDVTIAHPNENIIGRARLKESIFDSIRLRLAYSLIPSYQQGRVVHGKLVKLGFCFDSFVHNALVNLYSKCGDNKAAYKLVDEVPSRNVVNWNTMIARFLACGDIRKARELFDQMPERKLSLGMC